MLPRPLPIKIKFINKNPSPPAPPPPPVISYEQVTDPNFSFISGYNVGVFHN